MSKSLWLIWAVEGEYSDRSEWPVALCRSQKVAEAITERLGQLWRELHAIYKRREDELDDANDWEAVALWEGTPEGRELEALTGSRGYLGGSYADDRSYTCCEVSVLSAADALAAREKAGQQ